MCLPDRRSRRPNHGSEHVYWPGSSPRRPRPTCTRDSDHVGPVRHAPPPTCPSGTDGSRPRAPRPVQDGGVQRSRPDHGRLSVSGGEGDTPVLWGTEYATRRTSGALRPTRLPHRSQTLACVDRRRIVPETDRVGCLVRPPRVESGRRVVSEGRRVLGRQERGGWDGHVWIETNGFPDRRWTLFPGSSVGVGRVYLHTRLGSGRRGRRDVCRWTEGRGCVGVGSEGAHRPGIWSDVLTLRVSSEGPSTHEGLSSHRGRGPCRRWVLFRLPPRRSGEDPKGRSLPGGSAVDTLLDRLSALPFLLTVLP